MTSALWGSMTTELIARDFETAKLPSTSSQLSPPLVDLKRPSPASESPEALGSPVPTYSVRPLGSVGSTTMVPMALVVSPLETDLQVGLSERALLVRQLPQPA